MMFTRSMILQALLVSASFLQAAGEIDVCKEDRKISPKGFDSTSAPVEASKTEVTFHWERIKKDVSAIFRNTGETVSVTFEDLKAHTMIGGVQYNIANIEFHGGSDASKGSQHSVNGEFYSGEIEIYHYKAEYDTFWESFENDGGIAIVSVLLKEDSSLPKDLKEFKVVEKILPEIAESDEGMKVIDPFNKSWSMENLLPGNKDFFMYSGSFPSPPCDKAAKRIVLKTPISVTKGFLSALRAVAVLNN